MATQVKSMGLSKDQVNLIVEQIFEKVQKLIDKTLLPNIIEKLNRHEKILVKGNGRPALVDSAVIHTEKLKNIESSVANFNTFMLESKVKDQKLTDTIQNMERSLTKELAALTTTVGGLTGTVTTTEDWRKGVTAKTLAFILVAGMFGGAVIWVIDHLEFFRKLLGN